jgi:pilus assembly protein CpaC
VNPFGGTLGAVPSGNIPFGTFLQRVLNRNDITADVLVQALEEKGLARRLAEPNLVALSGDTANFLAGGEFPFPVPADDGNITIEFKQFGVSLAFTPTVLSRGKINLKIEPEVSELDPATGVSVQGTTVPGLIVRRASTTLELRDGQSFAMAGLLQFNNRKLQRQVPWLGSVPVLGALFRSASYQKNETDLVIIVTPHLVKPAVPGEHLVTPLEKSRPTNDVEFFLLGKQERWDTKIRRPDLAAGHNINLEDGESKYEGGGHGSFK